MGRKGCVGGGGAVKANLSMAGGRLEVLLLWSLEGKRRDADNISN